MSQLLVVLLHLNAELLYFDNELYHPYSFHSSDLSTTLIYSFVSILSVIFSLLFTFSHLVYRPIAAVIVQSKELLKAAKALRTEFSRYKLLRDFLEGTPSLFLFIVS